MAQILYPINHPGHTRQQNAGVISTRISGRVRKSKNKFRNVGLPFKDTFRGVTRTDTEEQQDSSERKATKEMKLLSQLSIVSQNVMTWRRFSHVF